MFVATSTLGTGLFYVTAVAVKKLVVGSRRVEGGTLLSVTALLPVVFARGFRVLLIECPGMLAGLL